MAQRVKVASFAGVRTVLRVKVPRFRSRVPKSWSGNPSGVLRAVKAHGHFPHDRSAMKLIYLVLREVERKWKRPTPIWHLARSEFSIRFGDRFRLDTG